MFTGNQENVEMCIYPFDFCWARFHQINLGEEFLRDRLQHGRLQLGKFFDLAASAAVSVTSLADFG